MKFKIFFLYVFAFFAVNSFPTTWHIKQDGTGNFTTIQEGIDVAANSDTVLVYPGIFFENLEIIEKGLTLCSLYLTTGDELYISQTVIDGNQASSVIRVEDSLSPYVLISGFIIQHGIGYLYNSSDRAGGGLFIRESYVTVDNCIIQYNQAESIGGIALVYSYLDLSGSTIRFNESRKYAGGLLIGNTSSVNFDSNDLNSIYLNYAGIGNDIFIASNCPFQEIIVDTFTVIYPDDNYYFIYPGSGGTGIPLPDNYSIDIQNGYVDQADQDIYVAPYGDDSNSGLTVYDPLQSISYALVKINADSLIQRTIHIADGTYSVSQNNQILPMQIKSYIDIIGESRGNTILDAEFIGGFFRGGSGQKSYTIENLSMLHHANGQDLFLDHNTNVQLKNLYMADSQLMARSMIFHYSDVTFENITIENCFPGDLYYYGTETAEEIVMKNCKFSNNRCNIPINIIRSNEELEVLNIINTEITDNEGLISEWLPTCSGLSVSTYLDVNIINSTIGNNFSQYTGAAVRLQNGVDTNIINSIIYGNEPYNVYIDGREGPITLTTNNSLIEGGESDLLISGTYNTYWDDETMLDEDPLWVELGTHSYALSEASPCINTGTLDFPPGVEIPAYDLAGNPRVMSSNIDMGAYEYPGNAAPIYLSIDNETLSWQIPEGHVPTEYNIYLDDLFQSAQSSLLSSYTYNGLIIGETYKAGVSAQYEEEETAVIPHYFTYQPVSSEDPLIPNPESQIPSLSNYPNPFNPSTNIKFSLKADSNVQLDIYNIRGQRVKTLVNEDMEAGYHTVVWNGRDDNNKNVSSGIYFSRFDSNDNNNSGRYTSIKKMILLK